MRDSLKRCKVMAHRNKLDRSALRCTVTVLLTLSVLMPLTLGEAADFQAGVEAYQRGDYAAAIREWLPLAEQGNAAAQFKLALFYDRGWGVPEDDAEAVKWYRKAAEQGDVLAQYFSGLMYANGRGAPEDDAEAVKWYRRAAEQGLAAAQAALGVMYATGRGVPEDDVQAYAWFNIAVAQGVEAEGNKKRIAESMTREQRAQAQELARQYWEAYVLPFQN